MQLWSLEGKIETAMIAREKLKAKLRQLQGVQQELKKELGEFHNWFTIPIFVVEGGEAELLKEIFFTLESVM